MEKTCSVQIAFLDSIDTISLKMQIKKSGDTFSCSDYFCVKELKINVNCMYDRFGWLE